MKQSLATPVSLYFLGLPAPPAVSTSAKINPACRTGRKPSRSCFRPTFIHDKIFGVIESFPPSCHTKKIRGLSHEGPLCFFSAPKALSNLPFLNKPKHLFHLVVSRMCVSIHTGIKKPTGDLRALQSTNTHNRISN